MSFLLSVPTIEVLITFLETRLAVFSAHTNVVKITNNGGHFEDELLLGGEMRHVMIRHSIMRITVIKFLLA